MMYCQVLRVFFFFKQKTAYEMRISDWSSDVCSSDLRDIAVARTQSFADQIRVAAVRAIQDAVDLAKAVQPVGRRIVSRFGAEITDKIEIACRCCADHPRATPACELRRDAADPARCAVDEDRLPRLEIEKIGRAHV